MFLRETFVSQCVPKLSNGIGRKQKKKNKKSRDDRKRRRLGTCCSFARKTAESSLTLVTKMATEDGTNGDADETWHLASAGQFAEG